MVIDEHEGKLGTFSLSEALRMAKDAEKDLVQVAASPIAVCKIVDYGKYKYNERKREQKKKKRLEEMKEIRLRPHIAAHDLEVKINMIRKILTEGRKVRVIIQFRGREREYIKPAQDIFETIKKETADTGNFVDLPKMDGSQMKAIISPK